MKLFLYISSITSMIVASVLLAETLLGTVPVIMGLLFTAFCLFGMYGSIECLKELK